MTWKKCPTSVPVGDPGSILFRIAEGRS